MDQVERISAAYAAALRPLYRDGWLETQRAETIRSVAALRETLKG